MAQRKLQQEIDKTFKRVAEGVATFESIYDKLQQSTNASQKDKLEDSLKKEIKKLQRSRDQIKAWAAQNDIKDKKPLLDQRKLIETQMEKFKAVEKEMKTKAYSKEGLSAAAKLDPKEKEKLEVCNFLSNMVEELERQIELREAEAEGLQATAKKGKKDTAKAERVAELERTTERHKWHQNKLELLLRALENGSVDPDPVKDIEDSIKYYVENNQEVDFMEDDSLFDEFNLAEEEDLYGMNNDGDRVSSQDAQSVQDDMTENDERPRPVSSQKTKLKSPLPALATLHTTPSIASNGPSAAAGMKPAPLPVVSTGQPLKYASAAAAAAASDKAGVGIAPLPPPPAVAATAAAARTSSSTSPSVLPSQPATISPSPQQPVSAKPVKTSDTPIQSKASPAPRPVSRPVETSTRTSETATPVEPPPDLNPKVAAAPLTNGSESKPSAVQEPESIYHLPSSLQDVLESFQATKSRSNAGQAVDERMLNASRMTCPSPLDAEKPNHYKPQSPYIYTPAHYPQEPLHIFDDSRLYNRIDTDTLFYAFYYRQGTYQQYLAAKALKSQSWRFHKQYQTWFQRHEEPKNITEEYEQGTYRFFDYESTWMNRRKADFKFAYKFLEDDI
ncbi:hypothetical protein ANO11243_038160 [Dothideomycetidae sp. 11243]|nr:hypothetical protein ANO11243_038160 [fungal sp. No.11243]